MLGSQKDHPGPRPPHPEVVLRGQVFDLREIHSKPEWQLLRHLHPQHEGHVEGPEQQEQQQVHDQEHQDPSAERKVKDRESDVVLQAFDRFQLQLRMRQSL